VSKESWLAEYERFEACGRMVDKPGGVKVPDTLKVYVVKWEFPTSENGETGGIVGVAATDEGARQMALADAREWMALGSRHQNIVVDGKMYDPAGLLSAEELEDVDEWDVWIEWDSYEVTP
jgi:hypothetical protein